jgi:hypothetical protein
MQNIKSFNFNELKLFAFYLGGKVDGCNIEMHDVVFVVGESNEDVLPQVKQKWIGTERSLHVDSFVVLENIDGFDIKITHQKTYNNSPGLYFVNLGSYTKDKFGENHFMNFCIAKSKSEAVEITKKIVPQSEDMIHGDNIYDIDDCIRLDSVDNYYIDIKQSINKPNPISINGYQKI